MNSIKEYIIPLAALTIVVFIINNSLREGLRKKLSKKNIPHYLVPISLKNEEVLKYKKRIQWINVFTYLTWILYLILFTLVTRDSISNGNLLIPLLYIILLAFHYLI